MIDYPTMSGPAIYRIRVRGRLDADLSDRLEGTRIENLVRNNGKAESVLGGAFSIRLRCPAFLTNYTSFICPLCPSIVSVAPTTNR